MQKETATIKCEAVFSKDKTHRYALSKTWDTSKPLAAVISIAPGADYNISADLTCQLIQNNLAALGFGGFTLCNLLSKVGADLKGLTSTEGLHDRDTDKMITATCEAAGVAILAWGKGITKIKALNKRANDVMALVAPFSERLRVISDRAGHTELNPVYPGVRHEWLLVKPVLESEASASDLNSKAESAEQDKKL